MSVPTLTNSDWVARLGAKFFRPEYSMTHVLFYVDRPVLTELADAAEDAAVESLVRALVPELRPRQPSKLFAPLASKSVRWKLDGGDGPPPCLAALALAVLAATEMRRDGLRPAHNYHAWFHELLQLGLPDVSAGPVWDSYADAYPLMWGLLQWWLDDRHHGQIGLSTIVEDPHYTKLGYADSQTIFSSSDREKLTQFFRWIGLRPGDELPPAELLEYFRAWAARRDDLSPGAETMLADEEEEPAQLAQLVCDAASRWRGLVRDDQGRLEARLSLTLSRPPASKLGLAAPCPPGFPETLRVDFMGREIILEAEAVDEPLAPDEQHWYGSTGITPSEDILSHGLNLVAGERVLRLPPHNFHVLHMSPELGCWASTEHLRPSQPAWVLVRRRKLDLVTEYLGEHARDDWHVVAREGVAPSGWALIRDVIIDPLDSVVPEGLERLAPRRSNRLGFVGGLPLPKGTDVYLTNGDPDLVLPATPEGAEPVSVRVDGEAVLLGPGTSRIVLADLDLEEGAHSVRVGQIARQYYTSRTLGHVSPDGGEPIGHSLRAQEIGLAEPTSLDASIDARLSDQGVRVRGALVESGDPRVLGGDVAPLLLPRAASRIVLLPDKPGTIERVGVPEKPHWMKQVGLECQFFEHYPSIDADWLMVDSPVRGLRLRRLGRGTGNEVTVNDPGEWREIVLSCGCAAPG